MLTLSSLSTELDRDFVKIYSCTRAACDLWLADTIEVLSGTLIGSRTYVSTTGYMLITFETDESTSFSGFDASYQSYQVCETDACINPPSR
jgi:hypothetical protein